ncbi:MAG: sensor histidine kinase, partial [Lachnospiraceae bacterium]|nr:sensor histidine kinase [Lachnospiraceae bacterium]
MKKQNNTERKRKPLSWSMLYMLLFGWLFPLLAMVGLVVFVVYGHISDQVEKSNVSAVKTAVEVCENRLEDCMVASRNASYLGTLEEAYKTYGSRGEAQELYNASTLFLAQQYKYKEGLSAAILYYADNPQKLYFTYNNTVGAGYGNITDYIDKAQERVLIGGRSRDTGMDFYEIGDHIYMVRNLKDEDFVTYGVLILELNSDYIFGSLRDLNGYLACRILRDGTVFYENGEVSVVEEEERRKAEEMAYVKGKDICLVSRDLTISDITFRVEEVLDKDTLYSEIWAVRYVFLILILFLFPLLVQLYLFFRRKVVSPLNKLVEGYRNIEEGRYGYEITGEADSQEFWYSEESFNRMSKELKNQFEKIYKEEIALRDARIHALQSQINPHFLNNTLEIINWEARMNGNEKVSAMIEALSTMLEATTNRQKLSAISLKEELDYVDAYIYIISARFGEKFAFTKEVPEHLLETPVPRLIIQPIVENAVEHGIDMRTGGSVALSIQEEADMLIIRIKDSGILTDTDRERIRALLNHEETPERINRVSIGIRNVDQRLKMLYDDRCGLTI